MCAVVHAVAPGFQDVPAEILDVVWRKGVTDAETRAAIDRTDLLLDQMNDFSRGHGLERGSDLRTVRQFLCWRIGRCPPSSVIGPAAIAARRVASSDATGIRSEYERAEEAAEFLLEVIEHAAEKGGTCHRG